MSTRISFFDAALTEAMVTFEPSWFQRVVLRQQPYERGLFANRGVLGGLDWHYAMTGIRVTDGTLLAEIDAERKLIQWAQRKAELVVPATTSELRDRGVR